jgi:hypothetical protein
LGRAKLTDVAVREIVRRRRQGASPRDLARRFHVRPGAVEDVLSDTNIGKKWSDDDLRKAWLPEK